MFRSSKVRGQGRLIQTPLIAFVQVVDGVGKCHLGACSEAELVLMINSIPKFLSGMMVSHVAKTKSRLRPGDTYFITCLWLLPPSGSVILKTEIYIVTLMVSCGERCYCWLDDNVRKRVMRHNIRRKEAKTKTKNKSNDAKAEKTEKRKCCAKHEMMKHDNGREKSCVI